MSGHTERDFETAIEAGLTGGGGYATRQLVRHARRFFSGLMRR